MSDPYQVLGVPQSATDDEIKAAYRRLAKKYHPDLNQGSAQAETKMKEINEAYNTLIKHKNQRPQGQSGYGGSYGGGYGGYGGGQSQGGGFEGFDFGGFEEFFRGAQSSYGGGSRSAYYSEKNPELKRVERAVLEARYQEALYFLAATQAKPAAWYYWSAKAHMGMGNRIAALNDARTAARMAPQEDAFRALLNELQSTGQAYAGQGAQRGFQTMMCGNMCGNPCLTLCVANAICNLCCGGGRGCYC